MSFKCPECRRVSHNPHDEVQRYCGACHKFFDEKFSFEQADTEESLAFGSLELTNAVNKTIAEHELQADEIFALVFLAEGRGHFMTMEAPADSIKFLDGKQLNLEQTKHMLVITKSKAKQVAVHFYREIELTKGAMV